MYTIDRNSAADVAQFVLETTAFAMTEKTDELPTFEAERFMLAELTYSGSRNGDIFMFAPNELCREWADTLMGRDDEDAWSDVLGEIANIVAGNWVSQAYPTTEDIKLNPPLVQTVDLSSWDRILDESAIALTVDGSPFLLQINPRD